jgi:transcriptional regulator with XRE-family HTH domain
MAKRASKTPPSIGERLRGQRVEVLKKGLREMARELEVAPAHLTDIETGKRSPSEQLLLKIAAGYQVAEAELRSAFSKPESVVSEIASESVVTAEKVPEFLRVARGLSSAQWDEFIQQAKKVTSGQKSKKQ